MLMATVAFVVAVAALWLGLDSLAERQGLRRRIAALEAALRRNGICP
jgi:spore maturation protein SpmA